MTPIDTSRGFRPACSASYSARDVVSAPSGSFHGPNYTIFPRIFFVHRFVACGKSGNSGYGLFGLPEGVGVLESL